MGGAADDIGGFGGHDLIHGVGSLLELLLQTDVGVVLLTGLRHVSNLLLGAGPRAPRPLLLPKVKGSYSRAVLSLLGLLHAFVQDLSPAAGVRPLFVILVIENKGGPIRRDSVELLLLCDHVDLGLGLQETSLLEDLLLLSLTESCELERRGCLGHGRWLPNEAKTV